MSIFREATLKCANCGHEQVVNVSNSVNIDRRPDLRKPILDGTFQEESCEQCGEAMRIPSGMTYIDAERGQWIAVDDIGNIPVWSSREAAMRDLWNTAYGAAAPEVAQEIGADLTPRLVFGWPALREKLVAADQSVNDLSLEILKMEILRNVAKPPLADKMELRLTGGTPEELRFTWIETENEAPVSTLAVPRNIYDDIDDQPEDWYELREKFDGALFVDMTRLLVPAA